MAPILRCEPSFLRQLRALLAFYLDLMARQERVLLPPLILTIYFFLLTSLGVKLLFLPSNYKSSSIEFLDSDTISWTFLT